MHVSKWKPARCRRKSFITLELLVRHSLQLLWDSISWPYNLQYNGKAFFYFSSKQGIAEIHNKYNQSAGWTIVPATPLILLRLYSWMKTLPCLTQASNYSIIPTDNFPQKQQIKKSPTPSPLPRLCCREGNFASELRQLAFAFFPWLMCIYQRRRLRVHGFNQRPKNFFGCCNYWETS